MPSPDRRAYRAHPIDGALLYFQPASGTYVRIEDPSTATLTRTAPRVVMFGITNVCNLRCTFCSRDASLPSRWTTESAAELLEELAAAGVLEVAFGGGEPFAFRGFVPLLERLHRSTTLALNVTTNGLLLERDRGMLERLAGILGQTRLSIYDERSLAAAKLLGESGLCWGANVLVDPRALDTLTAQLAFFAEHGAHDVSLLRYVEHSDSRAPTHARTQLDAYERERLARIVAASPLPCRLSVCFGDRVPVPRLFAGADGTGDCGAGSDFLTIRADGQVQSCSFQDASVPTRSAADILRVYREGLAAAKQPLEARHHLLHEASPRIGCARRECGASCASAPAPDPRRARATSEPRRDVRVWQGFSGNNSGECILVARFATAAHAASVFAELAEGYVPGAAYGEAWRALFDRERIAGPRPEYCAAPDDMIAVGRAFFAYAETALDDEFPELRALAWRRGGIVRAGGIHVHDGTSVVFAIRGRDASDARTIAGAAARIDDAIAKTFGAVVVGSFPTLHGPPPKPRQPWRPLARARDDVSGLAAGRPFAIELVAMPVTADGLTLALKRQGVVVPETPRLALTTHHVDRAVSRARAASLGKAIDHAHTVRNVVLVDPIARKKRLAIHGLRQGAHVLSLDTARVVVHAALARPSRPPQKGRRLPDEPALDPVATRARIDRSLAGLDASVVALRGSGRGLYLSVETTIPWETMTALEAVAITDGLELSFGLAETEELLRAVQRIVADVDARSKSR